MSFNVSLRKSVTFIFALAMFAVFSLKAMADDINSAPIPTGNAGMNLFPDGSIISQPEILQFSAASPVPIDPFPINFQFIVSDFALNGPWGVTASGTVNPITQAGSAIPPFAQIGGEIGDNRKILTYSDRSIPRQIIGIPLSPRFRIMGQAWLSPLMIDRVGIAPVIRTIKVSNRDDAGIVSTVGGNKRVHSEKGTATFPVRQTKDIALPIIPALTVEDKAHLGPLITPRGPDITEPARTEQADKAKSIVSPIPHAITDKAAIPADLQAQTVSTACPSVPEATGGDPSFRVEGEVIDGGIDVIFAACQNPIIDAVIQGDQLEDRSQVENRTKIHLIAGRNREIQNNPERANVGKKADIPIPIDRASDTQESPFIPLNSTGDRPIVNSVLINGQGKILPGVQRNSAKVHFALNPLTRNDVMAIKGGTNDVQRCSNRPRAPASDQRDE